MEKQRTESGCKLNSDVLQLLSVSRQMYAVLLTCLRERVNLRNLHQAPFMHQCSHCSCRSSASAATPPLPRFSPFIPYDSRVSLIRACTHGCICQHFYLITLRSAPISAGCHCQRNPHLRTCAFYNAQRLASGDFDE